ncbi:hypothetical protein LTR36_003046 [Oleoguttula mirabilis]|uniref:Uncharacterized protein n=1 Tax=Oleoguttula mirabilis TaxID=1507867 RepID=A0AAV9JWQ9_9PEZI|nr:hypothetical protein LTR36_003046 [Oleoguttula mirabilis]
MFREATMQDVADKSTEHTRPPIPNYKPAILRTVSLVLVFAFTIALIGLLQYAVLELPHAGPRSISNSSTPSPAARRDVPRLYPRNATQTSDSISVAPISSVGSALAVESDYVSTDVTQTIIPTPSVATASAQTTDVTFASTAGTIDYIPTDVTRTITPTSPTDSIVYGFIASASYVATDVTQTVTSITAITATSAQQTAEYVAPAITQTISLATTNSAYVQPDETRTIKLLSSTATTPVEESTQITAANDYVPADATRTEASDSAQQASVFTNTAHSAYVTTVLSATVLNLPLSSAAEPPSGTDTTLVGGVGFQSDVGYSTTTATLVLTRTNSGQIILSTTIAVSTLPFTNSQLTQYTQSTAYIQVVEIITPAQQSSLSTETTIVGGSTAVYIYHGSTMTSVAGGSTLKFVVAAQPTGDGGQTGKTFSDTDSGKGTVAVYHWSAEQTFLGTYLAVLFAVIYRILWTLIYNNLNLVEPFRQLAESDGALAEGAFFSFYQSQSNLLGPFPALLKRRWSLALTATVYLIACLLPALASETIYVDTNWGCANPMGGKNPCPARMTANVTILRVLQALLALAAIGLLMLILALLITKTGLPANPSSMATVASMMRHRALLGDLNETSADADSENMMCAMQGRRYRLGSYKDSLGNASYGILPLTAGEHGQRVTSTYGSGHHYEPVKSSAFESDEHAASHRMRPLDILLAVVVLGAFGVVLAYYLDGRDDSFNRFFNSDTFGPRFILTGAGTVIAALWKSTEQSAAIMAPYIRLAKRPSSAGSTILFTPSNTPVLSTVTAVQQRYFFVAAVTCVTLGAEALNIVISGVPYGTGQTWLQFLVSAYISIGVLSIMIIVVVMVLLARRTEPRIPRKPETLGAVMSYMAGSRLLDDFDGLDGQDNDTRDRRVRLLKKKYIFKEMTRRDGEYAWTVDEDSARLSYRS